VSRLPRSFRNIIIAKCKNYRENFHLTFPFIAEEDLDYNSDQDFFLHVSDLRGHQQRDHQFGYNYRINPLSSFFSIFID